MAAMIVFGSVTTDVLAKTGFSVGGKKEKFHVAPQVIPTPPMVTKNPFAVTAEANRQFGERMVRTYEERVQRCFQGLEAACAKRVAVSGPIKVVTRPGGAWVARALTEKELKNKQRVLAINARLAELEPKLDVDHIVEHITVRDDQPKRRVNIVERAYPPLKYKRDEKKRSALPNAQHMTTAELDQFILTLRNVCSAYQLPVDLIQSRKRVNRLEFHTELNGMVRPFTFVTLKHMNGVRACVDVVETPILRTLAPLLAVELKPDEVRTLSRGSSGLIFKVKGYTQEVDGRECDYFIMRGRIGDDLLDARQRLSKRDLRVIEDYSAADLFWRGFTQRFQRDKPTITTHECQSNLKVVDCGEIAGLLTQTLAPCGRITCISCMNELQGLTRQEYGDLIAPRVQQAIEFINQQHTAFIHVETLLTSLLRGLRMDNPNTDGGVEIYKLIGDRTEEPFSSILAINSTLMNCGSASNQDFGAATHHLLKLAQYMKNRTSIIASNDLKHFRNKRSAKTYFNADLMRDNQLDANGNFLWGKRAYHARRFFENYFDMVDPSGGYEKYIDRINKNGARRLAIGKLIVSTNFEAMRAQLVGEPVSKHPITEECISRKGDTYYYPGCCITNEDGTPYESELELPTKHHLVVGNTGEPKYIGLPQNPALQMYISKNGYCYINIFLAMLINVSEQDAKAFTKMVRDVMMPKLGEWPTLEDVATACSQLAIFYPDTRSAELPRILVDHTHKVLHVLDSYGSVSAGYHILKANTVNQFIKFALNDLRSPLKRYIVGGTPNTTQMQVELKWLLKGIYSPRVMKRIIEAEPYMLMLALVSPSILMAMFNSGSLEKAIEMWIRKDQHIANIMIMLSILSMRVSVAKSLQLQHAIIQAKARELLEATDKTFIVSHSIYTVQQLLQQLVESRATDMVLEEQGFTAYKESTLELVEKSYKDELAGHWKELTLCGKFAYIKQSFKLRRQYSQYSDPTSVQDSIGKCPEFVSSLLGKTRQKVRERFRAGKACVRNTITRCIGYTVCGALSSIRFAFPDFMFIVNTTAVISALLSAIVSICIIIQKYRNMKIKCAEAQDDAQAQKVTIHYDALRYRLRRLPTKEQFMDYLRTTDDSAYSWFSDTTEDEFKFQHKGKSLVNLERIIALFTLALMIVDPDRSDGVYKLLTKLKSVITTATQEPMRFQSLDDIQDIGLEKNLTIDFDISSEDTQIYKQSDITFDSWWNHQIEQNRVISHYRTEGHFMEFTRDRAASVANEIAHGAHNDILLRGAVGSGKSTGLPFHLCTKGKVLLLEPTRPLAENVHKQLRGAPFHVNPTLRMRGTSLFGSTPIVIMTTGFALHYYANNAHELKDVQFVIFDECHVLDANAIAFRSLLHEYTYTGKIIKASATPPGREVEFATQKPVKLKIEENLSMQQFVTNLGTGANSDVTNDGDNILVYVASYMEVDTLSKALLEKGYRVTKVDGRTMKSGATEIITSGTSTKKHFVVATNIIENGVTLDIDVVVDFGMKVMPEVDTDNRTVWYKKVSISYGERIQRLGRVGRLKEGTALRIGATERGLQNIPQSVATEAAFLCFTYGLPVMTSGVSTAILSECTILQAKTMLQFELPIYFMVHYVWFDGSMHPAVYNLLKSYKLRDSDTLLGKTAIPSRGVRQWFTAREYALRGIRMALDDHVKVPFFTREVPDKLLGSLHEVVEKHKRDAQFGTISGASVTKIAYTLQTDVHSISRTVCILDKLIEREMEKQAHFSNLASTSCSSPTFSLVSIVNAIRSRHTADYTKENLVTLHRVRNQLLEFRNIRHDVNLSKVIQDYDALECLEFQSLETMSAHLQLRGHWNKSLITHDIVVLGAVLLGGSWMIYTELRDRMAEPFSFQGNNKRQRQKLRFRDARDVKRGREVYGDDDTLQEYFGSAFTKKGRGRGTTRGMGKPSRKFTNIYGFDPSEYSFARYVDPITGYTLDEPAITNLSEVQDHFGQIRKEYLDSGEIEKEFMTKGIEAYFVRDGAKQILKIDLTPHNPLLVCTKHTSIAKFPEREFELRQTGQPIIIDRTELPEANEVAEAHEFESKSTFSGPRDYNPIASVVCHLKNTSDGVDSEMHGIGYGSVIITNQHLFRRNNGELRVRTHHGEFTVKNTTTLKMHPVPERDILLVQMPKDFPPFPRRLRFRCTDRGERVVMVGSNFQEKNISSTVSETSITAQSTTPSFMKHWITTKDGHCGLPIVATKDGFVLGIHSLSSLVSTTNMYTGFPDKFETEYLAKLDTLDWTSKWKLNVNTANWGAVTIRTHQPAPLFRTVKNIDVLTDEEWGFQEKSKWLYSQLHGNLKAMAHTKNALVTKHIVKGKCPLFQLYLETHPDARAYFAPLMGAYQKSRLNKEAYIKDLFKYASTIVVGVVDTTVFEESCNEVLNMLRTKGMTKCEYITDTETIITSLNMKAAVGALYSGKKKEYFATLSEIEQDELLRECCRRLYTGQLGVWNGSLKAELRTSEKVALNKTRTFTAAPLDTLLAGKVCVDDFNNKFYSLNMLIPSSVGMTKFYGGWDRLLSGLPDGWIYCDADGSQFDSSLSPYLINAVLRLRSDIMEEWDIGAQMLNNLYTEIIYTPIATPDGTIIKKYKGNNSGQPSTVVDNAIMVIFAMYYSIRVQNVDTPIDDVCKFYANGDDLLIAIRPDMSWLLDTFGPSFAQLGLNYTFDSRTMDKGELWFMSHRGVQYEGMYIPKLEEERIVSILEWDRANEPEHRLEAICASMIEAWGYDTLLKHIREFYCWILDQAPYSELSSQGKAPFISEVALKALYTGNTAQQSELERYLGALKLMGESAEDEEFVFQASSQPTIDAGVVNQPQSRVATTSGTTMARPVPDLDVNAGTIGVFTVPKIKTLSKLHLPRVRGQNVVNLDHLLVYDPEQVDISNARATQGQFDTWYDGIKSEYELNDDQMKIVLNGLMVWCIENGTSPNINGMWTMMDGDTQVEYPIRPIIENAKPTLRQIMAHFSSLAEAYIEKRNMNKPYMPRYGLQRNLTDMSLARYAFDFYEMTSKTPVRAREAHIQMKAAALRNARNTLFGLDGNVGTAEEDTERHTAQDVNRNMHNLLGVRM